MFFLPNFLSLFGLYAKYDGGDQILTRRIVLSYKELQEAKNRYNKTSTRVREIRL